MGKISKPFYIPAEFLLLFNLHIEKKLILEVHLKVNSKGCCCCDKSCKTKELRRTHLNPTKVSVEDHALVALRLSFIIHSHVFQSEDGTS